MSREFTVYFNRNASSVVTVSIPDDIEDDELFEAAIDAAGQKDLGCVCHQCSRKLSLGDPEAVAVVDADGETLWDDYEEQAKQRHALSERAAKADRYLAAIEQAISDLTDYLPHDDETVAALRAVREG